MRIYMVEAMKLEEKMIKCEKNMDISEKMLCQANRKDNGQLVVGYYFCMHHNDDRKHIHHFIIPLEADLSIGTPIEKIQVEIDPDTVHLKVTL